MAQDNKTTARDKVTLGRRMKLFGNILGIMGGFEDRMAETRKMAFNAQIAANNADLVARDISLRKKAGRQERQNISAEELAVSGVARSGFAAQGVDVGEGVSVDLERALMEQAGRQTRASREQEMVDVSSLEAQRRSLLLERKLMRRAERSMRTSTIIGAVGGAAGAYGSYMAGGQA